mgnify:CR=1 FL=1
MLEVKPQGHKCPNDIDFFKGVFEMTVQRMILVIAGSFIMMSLALGVEGSPLFVSKWALAFTAFVGANLFQFGFTKVCPMGYILKKLGVPESA